eukprot:1355119-Pleurochrysis_carterae.AAC.4
MVFMHLTVDGQSSRMSKYQHFSSPKTGSVKKAVKPFHPPLTGGKTATSSPLLIGWTAEVYTAKRGKRPRHHGCNSLL